jgi:hypothetical protein
LYSRHLETWLNRAFSLPSRTFSGSWRVRLHRMLGHYELLKQLIFNIKSWKKEYWALCLKNKLWWEQSENFTFIIYREIVLKRILSDFSYHDLFLKTKNLTFRTRNVNLKRVLSDFSYHNLFLKTKNLTFRTRNVNLKNYKLRIY